ncbi:hypothetical protein [Colwellia sp. Bg11-28]|uniref:hypothetical protein n=1 Tax=Colwellia sp. Bg11-28 TaxID=2058305 RepID=UPI0012FEA9EF|nr:hypothetical protein [Colwellia sp. Bg11-28]
MLVSHFIAEMGIGVFGAGKLLNWCTPRGALVEDPDLSKMDSRLNTSGMTASNANGITTQSSPLSTNTKPA